MFNISNNGIITLNKCDTFNTTIFVNIGNDLAPVRYILAGNDRLYFAVMEPHQDFANAVIKKVFTSDDLNEDGDVKLSFVMSDTENVLPGTYYYEVKLYIAPEESGEEAEVDTIVPRTKFIILR